MSLKETSLFNIQTILIEQKKINNTLYGRGSNSTDPKSKSVLGVEITHQPPGQQPKTTPQPDRNASPQHGFRLMGGFGL